LHSIRKDLYNTWTLQLSIFNFFGKRYKNDN
jgi:hypothetical protein